MDNEMMARIQEVVKQHLPAQVTENLRTALNQADADRRLVESLARDLDESRSQNKILTERVRTNGDIEEKRRLIVDAQKILDEKKVDAKIVELRERHASERVKEMKEVVMAVFANSKLKYNSYQSENASTYGAGSTANKSGGGEREE